LSSTARAEAFMRTQQPDNNQKNLLIAIILSVGVLLGWQVFYAGPKMKAEQERLRQAQEQQSATSPTPAQPPGSVSAPLPGVPATPAPGSAPPAPTREAALAASPRIAIETPALKGSIDLKGGRIDDLKLLRYRETVDPKSPPVVLLSPAGAPEPYFAEFGWIAPARSGIKTPDRESVWQAETGALLTPDKPLNLTWDNGQGLTFRRTISVDKDYMFRVSDRVQNKTGADVTLFPYARVFREGTPHVQGFFILHEGLIGVLGETGLVEITYSDALKESGSKTVDGAKGGWLGITDKYWATALIPNQNVAYTARLSGHTRTAAQRESYQADYRLPSLTVPPGEERSVESMLFAGARQVNLVESYAANYGILKFDLLIDWGWFYFITKPLFYLINWLYGLLGNFGLAILAVTVIVKAAFFPLANKSYESMAKMKKLQPEMELIRERYKDDKMRQQQELMALYKKQKINPLAGCLPILVQIPVFFALYKVLFVTIDMRHAPFFGWIKDLSAPDPTSIFNLFGLLPFAVPEFLHVGAWPIIMGLTMWLQMQLNPQQPDPIQQQIFNWMPVIFTFLLAAFPAGLVIYWAWNNVLSLAQQWIIMKKQGVDVPIVDNLSRNLAPVLSLISGGRFKPAAARATAGTGSSAPASVEPAPSHEAQTTAAEREAPEAPQPSPPAGVETAAPMPHKRGGTAAARRAMRKGRRAK
jgi:YidC/Oxa1 family membrane protein insertase